MLDESFDVDGDAGTPVIDDYDAKMPFKFTASLRKSRSSSGSISSPPNNEVNLNS